MIRNENQFSSAPLNIRVIIKRTCLIKEKCLFINCKLCCRKTRGMGAGRKLKTHRRRQRWADKAYKKSHLGNEWKKPFAGSSHAKGIVLEKM